MVAASRNEGGTQIISARVRKTIQSIKEIVGNHSDADIYAALKETNMDPNETAQKLLNQDPFHEVKRRREKKREGTGYKGSTVYEPRKPMEHVSQRAKLNSYSDRNVRRGGYNQNSAPVFLDAVMTREFRIVRDNRVSQNAEKEVKPPPVHISVSNNERLIVDVPDKSLTGIFNSRKPQVGHHSSQVSNSSQTALAVKLNDSSLHSTTLPSSSLLGLYSLSSNPVRVTSSNSRPVAKVGIINREFVSASIRNHFSEKTAKLTSMQTISFSDPHSGQNGLSREQHRSFATVPKSNQSTPTISTEYAVTSIDVSRPLQYRVRMHQQPVAHQKVSVPIKEWKPKPSQKTSVIGPGVIGTSPKFVSSHASNSKDFAAETARLQDKLSRANILENQNVIIAPHIRVSETDRCRLTFGSLGTEAETLHHATLEAVSGAEESGVEPLAGLSLSPPDSSSDTTSRSKQEELIDEHILSTESISPASGVVSEHQLDDMRESPNPHTLNDYDDIGLVRDNTPSSYPSADSQQRPVHSELSSFSAYDTHTAYDVPYFRPAVDDSIRGQIHPIPQEALSSHAANRIPSSSIAMLQQQQAAVAQIYPQVHVSHYANLLPYRQFLPPVYVPPMAIPGYSNNPPPYSPHPSSANSYLLMPGANTPHLTANGLKYGIQQFKPVPTGNPTGFGGFTNPSGYPVNAPGIIGSAAGLDDSSRIKYKEGNLYVPSPQAETSELWVNPRELTSMQSASYYNLPAQTPHAAAYMPSATGHASFNAAAQSSHMQFSGLYQTPPPQPATIAANPHHHMGTLGSNVGVGMAPVGPGSQVGAYQQPQLGHLNWAGNF